MTDPVSRLTSALAARYSIEGELGSGGMATVYLAHDRKHDRKVALKVFRPELAAALGPERFVREIKITANLSHPHILPLLDSGEADGFFYYVMPLVDGDSLRDRLHREKQLSVEEALKITSRIASALSYAHSHDIVHRDIKPENILFQAGEVVVADFGIALAVDSAGGTRLTETGFSLGTPAYMSPEQASGEQGIDARSDIYSLACVLYEMLAGDPPFVASSPRAVLAKHMTDPAPPITTVRASVPSPVAAALGKALGKAPADRFESAKAFSEALFATEQEAKKKLSIVVLPFENLSPDPDNAFFADGLTDELIADLSKVRALTVISRTSAMMYKGAQKSAPSIAEELHVRYVLEGTVRRAGHNLRITAQLIDGSSDAHLWAEKYSGTVDDAFDLQEQLSRRIVEALKGALTPDEERRLATRATDDPRVNEVWMRARHVAFSLTRQGIEEGLRLVTDGLQAFGDHALLHAANGVLLYLLYEFGFSSDEETLDRCTAAATRALEMNPHLPQALYAKGLSVYKRGDCPEAVRYWRRVLDVERNSDALWYLGFVLAEAGKIAEARGYADEAVERDPLVWTTRFGRVVVDLFAGEFGAAVVGFEEMVGKRGMGDLAFAQWWLGQALAYAGDETEAVAAFESGSNAKTGFMSDICELGARAFRGEPERVREWFESNEGLQQAVLRDETFPRYVAQCFARVGAFDEALRWLERAMDWGFTNHRFLAEQDRGLVALRGDPRFSALLERARQKQRAFDA